MSTTSDLSNDDFFQEEDEDEVMFGRLEKLHDSGRLTDPVELMEKENSLGRWLKAKQDAFSKGTLDFTISRRLAGFGVVFSDTVRPMRMRLSASSASSPMRKKKHNSVAAAAAVTDDNAFAVGTKVRKQKKGKWVSGYIYCFKNPNYCIAYKDGCREELSEDQVAAILDTKSSSKTQRNNKQTRHYPVGTTLRKYFGRQHGWFRGTVVRRSGSMYRIKYEDDDSEDMSEKELSGLVVKESPPPAAASSKKKKAASKGKHPYPVGTKVRKYFQGHGWFTGAVTAFDGKKYSVKYEDDDSETMTKAALAVIVVDDDETDARKRPASTTRGSTTRRAKKGRFAVQEGDSSDKVEEDSSDDAFENPPRDDDDDSEETNSSPGEDEPLANLYHGSDDSSRQEDEEEEEMASAVSNHAHTPLSSSEQRSYIAAGIDISRQYSDESDIVSGAKQEATLPSTNETPKSDSLLSPIALVKKVCILFRHGSFDCAFICASLTLFCVEQCASAAASLFSPKSA